MDVRQVDPADTQALRAWWEAGRTVDAHDRARPTWPAWSTTLTRARTPDPRHPVVRLAGWADGRVVAVSTLGLATDDNAHLVFVSPAVLPQERRRGHGTALVAAGERIVAELGRTTILTEVFLPPDADPEGDPTVAFARTRGYELANDDEVKVADLAGHEAAWPLLAASAAERHRGYRLECWAGPTPEDRLDAVCAMFSLFLGEIPLGDLDIRPQRWTHELLRDAERHRESTGRRALLVAVFAPDGAPAGFSNLWIDDGTPERASIDSTLVLPGHRGHRLGLALKVRLHQELRERFPAVTWVVTENAAVNRWMNAVNDRLGYVVTERCLEMQKVTSELA